MPDHHNWRHSSSSQDDVDSLGRLSFRHLLYGVEVNQEISDELYEHVTILCAHALSRLSAPQRLYITNKYRRVWRDMRRRRHHPNYRHLRLVRYLFMLGDMDRFLLAEHASHELFEDVDHFRCQTAQRMKSIN